MRWNWQDPDWPHFRWDAARLSTRELAFAEKAGVLIGTSSHLDQDNQSQLIVDLMSRSALDSSAIEGEVLDRDSVQSSVRRHLGLQADDRRPRPAEDGVAGLMVSLFFTIDAALDHETLFAWHEMVMAGSTDLEVIGGYRRHPEPMQIVSGPDYRRKVHFEAPPSSAVPAEMDKFLAWFARTGPQGVEPMSPVTRAGIAHLWFETIHPFEDGNGRLGRVIAEKALAQGRSAPMLTGISSAFMQQRKHYYDRLEAASLSLDVDEWLDWFVDMTLMAQGQTVEWVEFLISKAQMLGRLAGRLNGRQEKAMLRLFRAGPGGFAGGMSAENYRSITGATPPTATRDLADLVDKGALQRTGERKGTRYWLMAGKIPDFAI
jgi:Fic family protein